MDVEDGTTDISVADNLFGTSVSPPNLSVGADPAVAPSAHEGPKEQVGDGEGEYPPDIGREHQIDMPDGMPGASVPLETIQEPKEGVAPDPPAGQTEVVTKEAGAARLRKMLIGVEDGPVASGDDKALDKHTFGTLKIVKQATALLNISTNAAVHAACGPLDD